MVKVSLVLCFIAVWAITGVSSTTHSHAHASAPAPSVDCFSLILTMSDCLTYVSTGSTSTKPEGGCCSGLKKVLKVDAECICVAFKNSAKYGVTLNVTKAATLPSACGVKAPPIAKCDLSVSPSPAPANAPESPGPTSGMGPSGTGGSSGITAPSPAKSGSSALSSGIPAPSPAKSGASALSIPFVAFVSVVVASCSFF